MTCPTQEALYRWPHPGQTRAETAALRAHVAECESCAATVRRIELARRTLREEEPPALDARAQARIWTALPPEETYRSDWYRFVFEYPRSTIALAAAACALLLFLLLPEAGGPKLATGSAVVASVAAEPGATLPLRTPVAVAEEASVQYGKARIEVAPSSELSFDEGEALTVVQLERGAIRLDVEPLGTSVLAVVTPVSRIEVVGTRFSVAVGDRTRVEVEQGKVRVQPTDPAEKMVMLSAGERWVSAAPQDRADLDAARALVIEDAPRARAIARSVLSREPPSAMEAEALALIADAYRRSNEPGRAAELYAQVARHPAGRGYAEEALLRRARLLSQLKRTDEALAAVKEADHRFANGALDPERKALAARIWLEQGEASRAARILLSAPQTDSLALQTAQLTVAKAMKEQDPERARMLLKRVVEARAPEDLRAEANRLIKTIER